MRRKGLMMAGIGSARGGNDLRSAYDPGAIDGGIDDGIGSAGIAFEAVGSAVAGAVIKERIGIGHVKEDAAATAQHGPWRELRLPTEADARAESRELGIVDVADVSALEGDVGRRRTRTEHREILLAVVHRLHEVIAQAEVDVECRRQLIAVLREEVDGM